MRTRFTTKSLPYLLFMIMITTAYSQSKIISTGDEWFYYDKKAAPPTDWFYNKVIDSSNWGKGISPLGYGEDEVVKTNISFGGDPENKDITKYFKKTFTIGDPYEHLMYTLKVQRDDGVVIYLNGKEIMRNNMPNGTISHKTKASSLIFSSSSESISYTKQLSPDELISGVNVISASVHQARKTSSDCIFNLELEGHDDPKLIPLLLKEQTIKNLQLDMKLKELTHNQALEKEILGSQIVEQSRNNYQLYFIVTLSLLICAIILVLYLWRNFSVKEKQLNETISDLEKYNESKDREMMNTSLNFINNKQFLIETKRKLEDNLKSTDFNKKDLKPIINSIDFNLDYDDDWETLKKHFNAVHTGYVDRLRKLHPSLTDIELRHCIFIKLHMQTKEIATILHIEPRSVQAARYRLKKKIDLDESTDLKDYLLSI